MKPQVNDVAFLNGTVYVYCDRPLYRNPWVPVNQSGRGLALSNEDMGDALLLVRDGRVAVLLEEAKWFKRQPGQSLNSEIVSDVLILHAREGWNGAQANSSL